ncbi:hypothetical protein ABZ372_47065, partial [Streptomyces sp. NPDC005921]
LANRDFHRALYLPCGNPLLARMLDEKRAARAAGGAGPAVVAERGGEMPVGGPEGRRGRWGGPEGRRGRWGGSSVPAGRPGRLAGAAP